MKWWLRWLIGVLAPVTVYVGVYGAFCLFPRGEPLVGRVAYPFFDDSPGNVAWVVFRPLVLVHEGILTRRAVATLDGVWVNQGEAVPEVFPGRIAVRALSGGAVEVSTTGPYVRPGVHRLAAEIGEPRVHSDGGLWFQLDGADRVRVTFGANACIALTCVYAREGTAAASDTGVVTAAADGR